jgi:hypothetical protein
MATWRCSSPSPEITVSPVCGSWLPCRVGSSSHRRERALESLISSFFFLGVTASDTIGVG